SGCLARASRSGRQGRGSAVWPAIAALGHFSLLPFPNCGTEASSPKKRIRLPRRLAMEWRRVVAAAGILIVGLAGSVGAQSSRPGPDEMIDNPPFANLAQFKPGTIVTQKEVVSMPDGRKLEQLITYKLVQKNKQH